MTKETLRRLALPLALVVAMMSTMLYGCGSNEPVVDSEPTETVETEVVDEGEETTNTTDGSEPEGIGDAVAFGTSTETSPVPFEQWAEITVRSSEDKTYHTAYARIIGVSNDPTYTQECLDLHNSIYSFPTTLEDMKLPSDVKLNVVDYEVYIPADIPSSESGIYGIELSWSAKNPEGGGIPTADGSASYIGLGTARNMDTVENPEYLPGGTYKLRSYYAMVDGYTDYIFDTYSYPDGTADDSASGDLLVHNFFACK